MPCGGPARSFGGSSRTKQDLSEEERYAVADHVVAQLKERGDPWRLAEEVKAAKAPTT
jgi:hypothetical protein